MTISGFASLIEVFVGLNIAFTALNDLSSKVKILFVNKAKKQIENNDPNKLSISRYREHCVNEFKNLLEKSQAMLNRNLDIKNSKLQHLYIIAAMYGMSTLFYIGFMETAKIQGSTIFFLYSVIIIIYIFYAYFKEDHSKLNTIIFMFFAGICAWAIWCLYINYFYKILPKVNVLSHENSLFTLIEITILFLPFIISFIVLNAESKNAYNQFCIKHQSTDCYSLIQADKEKKDAEYRSAEAEKNIQEVIKREAKTEEIDINLVLENISKFLEEGNKKT